VGATQNWLVREELIKAPASISAAQPAIFHRRSVFSATQKLDRLPADILLFISATSAWMQPVS
jgi:hypothetical protein